ncbi:MAG: hypothetical protein ACOCZ5_03655 [bacterium]
MSATNTVLQILISAIDLYFHFKSRGYEFDEMTEKEMREKLRLLNTELKDLPDLPTE